MVELINRWNIGNMGEQEVTYGERLSVYALWWWEGAVTSYISAINIYRIGTMFPKL